MSNGSLRVRIECPSCRFSGDVKAERVPEKGGNAKCPRCSTVFFFGPIERPIPEEIPPLLVCPNCGFSQHPAESCAKCEIIFAKYKPHAPQPQPPPEPQPVRISPLAKLDGFQVAVIVAGALATVFSLVKGAALIKAFETSTLRVAPPTIYGALLPTIGTAECLFLIFALYSVKRRRAVGIVTFDAPSGSASRVHASGIRDTTVIVAASLFLLNLLGCFIGANQHSDGAVGLFLLSGFMGASLLLPLGIGFLLGRIRTGTFFYCLTAFATVIEVATYAALRPLLLLSHVGSMTIHTINLFIYGSSPLVILSFAAFELYQIYRDERSGKRTFL